MKLSEQIIKDLEFKTKKNNSLVSFIENIKHQNLVTISDKIDNPNFLNEFSSGWNALHYAVLNNSPEVLYFMCNLYKKHNCDINQHIKRAKNGTTLGSTALDVALSNQKLEQFIILQSFNVNQHKNISFYIHHFNKLYSSVNNKTVEELNLPYEKSLANLFMFHYEPKGINLLSKNIQYDEKPQVIKEFLENHIYMVENYYQKNEKNNKNEEVFKKYSSFFNSLIEQKDKLDFHIFDFFALILLKNFDLHKQSMDSDSFTYFEALYKNNKNEFFEHLEISSYKKEVIDIFKSMQQWINENKLHNKNLKNFIEKYQIDKLLLSVKLEDKLSVKNIAGKTIKI